jgi:hypothetical protein
MNVYQEFYTEQFIKELPVDFHKIKNMDLTKVPEEYHSLFTTDWNWGKYSKMPITRRMILQQLFLEYQHNDMQASIQMNKPITEKISEGGFSRDRDDDKLQGFIF